VSNSFGSVTSVVATLTVVPDTNHLLLGSPQWTAAMLTLHWSGVGAGQSVSVQASSNLTNWTVVATPPAGVNQLDLPLAPGEPARFFRLSSP